MILIMTCDGAVRATRLLDPGESIPDDCVLWTEASRQWHPGPAHSLHGREEVSQERESASLESEW